MTTTSRFLAPVLIFALLGCDSAPSGTGQPSGSPPSGNDAGSPPPGGGGSGGSGGTPMQPPPGPAADGAADMVTVPPIGMDASMPPPPPDGGAVDNVPTTPPSPGVLPNFPGTRGNYGNGHLRFSFPANGKTITVYAPQKPREGLPWVWHGEFPDVIPSTNNAWLNKGLMIVYVGGASEQYGCPDVVKVWEAAYATLVGTYKMAPRMVITGISRGGLYAYNFAAANPEKVAGIYADNGTCDFRSWPGGRQLGDPRWVGPGGGGAWQTVLRVYKFASTADAIAYPLNPVDNLAPLARGGVRLLHVTAQMDSALPWKENTGLIEERYPKLGGSFTVIYKPTADHHPHGLEPDPTRVVDWTVDTLVKANGLAP